MSLTAHLLVRITLVGVLCWLGVSAAVVWRLQREGNAEVQAQADRLHQLTERQLHRQLVAQTPGNRVPDLARVAADDGRPVCLRYQAFDVPEAVSWGCDPVEGTPAGAPRWLVEWVDRHDALPRAVHRTVTLWLVRDGILTVEPSRALLLGGLWRRLCDLTGMTAATILAVNTLVLLALRRLLRPTEAVLQALDRLRQGDLATAPRAGGPREFARILEAVEALRCSLLQLTSQRSALTARLIESQETERRELARELHDEMGQGLAALQAVSAGLRISAQAGEVARTEDTETLDETIDQLHAGLRALLGRVRPPLLDGHGPEMALRELVSAWNRRQRCGNTPLQARLVQPRAGWAAGMPEGLALALYRTAQEALTNAARYASADLPVDLCIEQTPEHLDLQVRNACDPGRAGAGSGLGLRMLAERVASLGGTLQAGPVADAGSRPTFLLQARWPRT